LKAIASTRSVTNDKTLLVDFDSICYKKADKCIVGSAGAAGFEPEDGFVGNEEGQAKDVMFETHTLADGTVYELETSLELARVEIDDFLNELLDISGCKDYILFTTAGTKSKSLFRLAYNTTHEDPEPCFRYAIAEENLEHGYKHSRTSKPLGGYITMMTAAVRYFDAYMFDYLEADDAIVAVQSSDPDKYILAAMDKDVLNQAIGTHINYHKLEDDWLFETGVKKAKYYKYWQAIVGDPSDGYKGVPRIGKVGAEKFINPDMTEVELWNNTLAAYKSKGLGVKECLATLRLADMQQATYNKEDESFSLVLYEIPEGGNK